MAIKANLPTINRADRSDSEDARRRRSIEREVGAPRGTIEPNASLRRFRPAQSRGAELTRHRGGENAARVQTPSPQSPTPRQTAAAPPPPTAPPPQAGVVTAGEPIVPIGDTGAPIQAETPPPEGPLQEGLAEAEAAHAEVQGRANAVQAQIDADRAHLAEFEKNPFYGFQDEEFGPVSGQMGYAAIQRRIARREQELADLQPSLRAAELKLQQTRDTVEGEQRLQDLNTQRMAEIRQQGLKDLAAGETSRLNQLNTGIAALGLGDSLLGERIRRSERQVSAVAREQFLSATSVQELAIAFQAENDAINRLWQSGENELAYLRQVELFQMQVAAVERLQREQQQRSWWKSIASFGFDALLAFGTGGASLGFSIGRRSLPLFVPTGEGRFAQ